jgi:phosphoribosylaminoimidazolecarboxamide formyltransferase/IMP cyclohydrolase
MSKRAILSVYDKTGLLPFGRALSELGWELVASGGTARALREAGLEVLDISAITGAPEMLGGRVKTLHPAVHGGILARPTAADRGDLDQQGIAYVDLVVCNLYPFTETVARPDVTLAEAIEHIDIGGVTLLRAAAKNFDRVWAVCDPADYPAILAALQAGESADALRRDLALKAFAHTRDYDTAIVAYLSDAGPTEEAEAMPSKVVLSLSRVQSLRYGENPHQAAALYAATPDTGPLGGTLLQGKELSYNNLLDLDAAWRAAEAFAAPAVVIVKHLSPCGMATADSVAAAFPAALASDPVSAFGGVIATNRPVDGAFVSALATADLFVEAVIAPGFDHAALDYFATKKKNCRLVALGETQADGSQVEYRSIRGGFVAQTRDQGDPPNATWRTVSARPPSPQEDAALRFAWLASQHVKSNAIVLATDGATVGIGGGLPSRVDAVMLAAAKAGDRARGAVLASDAFFPFADGIEAAAAAGVTAVVQPGGSVRDDEVIAAADRLGLAMFFTGARHFRH